MVRECSNCGNKAIFIWWEPCKSCTPNKSNWKPKPDDEFFEEYRKLCRKYNKIIDQHKICELIYVTDLEEEAYTTDLFKRCDCK